MKIDTVSIKLPDGITDAFDNTTIEQIEWYLASANDWDFKKTTDKFVAVKNTVEPVYQPFVQISVFSRGFFDNGAQYESTQIIEADTLETLDIDVYRHPKHTNGSVGSDRFYSSITIRFTDEFYIRLNEYSYDMERGLTIEAIQEVFMLFDSPSVQKARLLLNGSINQGIDSLSITRNSYGTSDISGYVHLDKKGTCWIRVVDAATSRIYYDQQSDDQSEFFIGWSDEENDHFSFFQRLTIKRKTDAPESADVVVQLWVDDEDGKRCVSTTNTNLTFWRR
ncbi:MAG: hypothetical protein LBU61_00455 [Coriobacteriales bacterium]|jgi:hypothetical protein|nr:hypothetical protein [Coriobacteriales bacterium]